MNSGGMRSHDNGNCRVYVGTYTNGASKGIYLFHFSIESGVLSPVGLVAETMNPSFLALHPSRKFLYAVGEVKQYEGQTSGFVSAYSIDSRSGGLNPLGSVPSNGVGPCHVALDRRGKFAVVSNYVNGSVAVFKVENDGRLGDVTAVVQHSDSSVSPAGPRRAHAHGAYFSAENRFVVVPDLGLEKLFVYRFDPQKGALDTPEQPCVELPPGSGPRHFAFRPNNCFGYVLNERNSTVTAFRYVCSRGALQQVQQVSTLPSEFCGENATAEIELDRDGSFLYASNRGADSLAVFAVSSAGHLSLVEHAPTQGKTPRHFAIHPSGEYLVAANQDTNNLVVFRRNRTTGHLTQAGQQSDVPAPVCVLFAPFE